MANNNYKIFVESAHIGNRLFLDAKNTNLDIKEWAVEDAFNGKTRFYKVEEELYGFFVPGNYVDLYVVDARNNQHMFKNVPIVERK